MRKLLYIALIFLCTLSTRVFAQSYSEQIDKITVAIAHAEGFGVRGVIPTVCHNPGDIKGRHLEGQLGACKGGHSRFKNDKAGWKALRNLIERILSGNTKHYRVTMTFAQMGKVYAGNSKIWTKNVTKELGVAGNVTLFDFVFRNDMIGVLKYAN